VLHLYIITAWNDYFSGTTPTNLPSQTYTSRPTPSGPSVYVLNCLFRSITSGSTGGALYCTSVTYLLVESTSFFSCKTSSGSSGAIYFYNGGGQCVLYEVCGYDCSTPSNNGFQFVYIVVNNTVSSKNYFNYSSISRCVNGVSYSWYILGLGNGKICCPSVNISMNKCYGQLIYCYPLSDSNSVTCSFSYSTFTNNIANWATCIWLWTSGAKFEIKSCNILRNTQGSLDSEGTIYTTGYLTIYDSCILENKANYIFRQYYSSYPTTLSNCTVDSTSNNGYLTIKNTVTKSFILALNHMSTLNCHSEYDSAGTLTPIIQTPYSSKKQICYYSCEKYFLQLRLSDFVSLISVLIFSFIHPYASNDLLNINL
jgi:hypothetical protein